MLRKLGLAISYFIAVVYLLLILLPLLYCYQHQWCKGPGEGDGFMPAFMLTPLGAIATAFSLHNAIQHIRKRQPWSWAFWPLAIIFALVLLGVTVLSRSEFITWQLIVRHLMASGAPEAEGAAAGGCAFVWKRLWALTFASAFGAKIKFQAWLRDSLDRSPPRGNSGYPPSPLDLWNHHASAKFPAKYGCQRA